MLCVLPGIIFGLANAAQKNAMTMMTHRIAISSGLVTFHPPMLNSFRKLKSSSPGAGYPHPLKMWQPSAAAARSPVTDHLPSGGSPARCGRPYL